MQLGFRSAGLNAVYAKDFSRFNSPKALPAAIAHLKRREASRRDSRHSEQTLQRRSTVGSDLATASSPNDQVTTTAQSVSEPSNLVEETWQPPNFDEDGELFVDQGISSQALATQMMSTHRRMEAESNKENLAVDSHFSSHQIPQRSPKGHTEKRRWIDRQEDAQKLTFSSPEPETPHTSTRQGVLNDRDIEEPNTQDDDEISEDEGFQEDRRPVQRRNQLPLAQRPVTMPSPEKERPMKRVRVQSVADSAEDDVAPAVARHNRANNPNPTASQVYKEVNNSAKLHVAVRPKKIQTREPWSEVETERLLELIEEYGLSWSQLKKMDAIVRGGPVLVRRDQVALKDKARNMKLDYLKYVNLCDSPPLVFFLDWGNGGFYDLFTKGKLFDRAGTRMPVNFEGIPLNKLQIQKLAVLDIEYDAATGRRVDAPLSDDEE